MTDYTAIISTPVGHLGIITDNQHLLKIDFLSPSSRLFLPQDSLTQKVIKQLNEYFLRPSNYIFNLPIHLTGTTLQVNVWSKLKKIPPGKTLTYSELANQVKTHPRVIGNICRANPIPIVIPCHRVIAKQSLGGFCGKTSGHWPQIKQWLLDKEKS